MLLNFSLISRRFSRSLPSNFCSLRHGGNAGVSWHEIHLLANLERVIHHVWRVRNAHPEVYSSRWYVQSIPRTV